MQLLFPSDVGRQDNSADSFDMTATLGYSRSGDSEAHEFVRSSMDGFHSLGSPARRAACGRLQRTGERARDGAGGSRDTC